VLANNAMYGSGHSSPLVLKPLNASKLYVRRRHSADSGRVVEKDFDYEEAQETFTNKSPTSTNVIYSTPLGSSLMASPDEGMMTPVEVL
jgi:hypothetical protein